MLRTVVYGELEVKASPPPLVGITSWIPGQRYLSTLLKQMCDDDDALVFSCICYDLTDMLKHCWFI